MYGCSFLLLVLIGDLSEDSGVMSLAMNIVYCVNPALFIVGLFGSYEALYSIIIEFQV